MPSRYCLTLLSFCTCIHLFAQYEAILLYNPSFEAISRQNTLPSGWFDCGARGESLPDIHHNDYPGAHFGIDHPSIDGDTYLGMVARDNGTKEGIGQRLEKPLQAGQCYTFSFFVAKSDELISGSRLYNSTVNYDAPLHLIIWGGFKNCAKQEMLGRSTTISHVDWKRHTITIQPKAAYTHISLQASHASNVEAYNGNLLLDHCSPLIPVACPETEEVINWMPEKIIIEPLEGEAALRDYLSTAGAKIRSTHGDYMLELHCFADKFGQVHQLNKYVWEIAQALKQFPNYSIHWLLAKKESQLSNQQYIQLAYQMQKAGLSRDQFQIIYHNKRKMKKGDWLWPLGTNNYCAQLVVQQN